MSKSNFAEAIVVAERLRQIVGENVVTGTVGLSLLFAGVVARMKGTPGEAAEMVSLGIAELLRHPEGRAFMERLETMECPCPNCQARREQTKPETLQ